MTTPDDTDGARGASSGATRTPPPRTRRGAPVARSSFPELDELDDLLQREQRSASAEPLTEPTPARTTRPKRGAPEPTAPTGAGSTETRAPSPTFDWETPEERAARESALAAATAAEVYGDPVEPEVAFEPEVVPAPRPAKPVAAKRPERRFRQTVQKVDLWSVTKMALCFYVSAMGVVLVSMVALWVVADSAGIIDNVENFVGDLFSSEDFQFVSGQVLRGAVLIGVVVVALMVAFTIIAASFYNIFAELFGGVEIVIREEEQPPKR